MRTAHIAPGMTGWATARTSRQRFWCMRTNDGAFVSVSGIRYTQEEIDSFEPATRNPEGLR